MPDIIQNGIRGNGENLPWWDGLQVQCLVCACTYAMNGNTDLAHIQISSYGTIPIATLPCPECANPCSVSWMQHQARIPCASLRNAIDAEGEPPPLFLRDKFVVEDDPDRTETKLRERMLASPKKKKQAVTANEIIRAVQQELGTDG